MGTIHPMWAVFMYTFHETLTPSRGFRDKGKFPFSLQATLFCFSFSRGGQTGDQGGKNRPPIPPLAFDDLHFAEKRREERGRRGSTIAESGKEQQ